MQRSAVLRMLGTVPLALLGLAGAVVPSEFWRSWGELTVVLDNERLGGPFLPAFLATLFAYAPWSRFRVLRVLGYLVNLAAGLVLPLMSAMMVLVTAGGGPDARTESMPPIGVPLLFLVLFVLSLACPIALVASVILGRRERAPFPSRMTWGEAATLAVLLCLAAGATRRREALDTRQRARRIEAEESERSRREKAEAGTRRKEVGEAPKTHPPR